MVPCWRNIANDWCFIVKRRWTCSHQNCFLFHEIVEWLLTTFQNTQMHFSCNFEFFRRLPLIRFTIIYLFLIIHALYFYDETGSEQLEWAPNPGFHNNKKINLVCPSGYTCNATIQLDLTAFFSCLDLPNNSFKPI